MEHENQNDTVNGPRAAPLHLGDLATHFGSVRLSHDATCSILTGRF